MTNWTTVSLYDTATDREIAAGENEPVRIAALAEYNRSGSIHGVFMVSAEEYRAGGDDLVDRGPSASEIDWTGFDAALAAFKRAHKGRDNWRRWLDADGVAEARDA